MPTVILFLALLNAGAGTADGFSTKYWEHSCRLCTEAYPVRLVLSGRPTWPKMLNAGATEVEVAYKLATFMQASGKWPRRFSWAPQAALIVVHSLWAARNYRRSYAGGYAH
jgi:hypothetical protein